MATAGSFGTPEYRPGRGGNFKPLRNTENVFPRVGQILSVPAQDFMNALAAAFTCGCAVLISPTSDAGALSVTLYAGEQRHRAYATTAEEFADTLRAVQDVAEAHLMGGSTSRQNGPLKTS